jgi:hypothetical protein
MALRDDITNEPDHDRQQELNRLRKQLADSERKRQAAERSTRELQQIIDLQSSILEKRAKQLFRSPKASKTKGHFHRVLIPDTHGAHIDHKAAAALLGDLEYLQPREVVWLGDHLDCGGFLARHHTMGFVAEAAFSFADDIAAANDFIDAVQQRTPKAVHHFLTGNHEHRIEKWCCTHALGNDKDANLLLQAFGVHSVLHLQRRGINYYSRGHTEPDLRTRGAIKLGECYFVHDVSTARNAAQVAISKWGTNVMFGDTHRIDYAVGRKAERDIVAATNGCLSTLRPYWQETNITDWSHGYGVQIVMPDGKFLHIIVPIVDGKSLLGPMLGRVK